MVVRSLSHVGHMTLKIEACTLDALLSDVVHMLRPKAEEKGLEFAVERAEDVPALIHTDKTKLQQILANLVANAIKFTSEGSVRLQVARDSADHLQFAVVDTGPGIAEEEKAAVFQAFQQTQSGMQSREGTGLGMALSQKFVAVLGGQLHLESAVGVGSTFTFTIRLDAEPAEDRRAGQHAPDGVPDPADAAGRRILVVDDSESNRQILKGMLEAWGFQVSIVLEREDWKEEHPLPPPPPLVHPGCF